MTLLEGELEEWQTGKKKSEQIAQLQSEIAAMETALEGMTEVTIGLLLLLLIFWCTLYTELLAVQVSNGRKRSLTRQGARVAEVDATRGTVTVLCT